MDQHTADHRVTTVAVTGDIGAGKSTVARMLASLGAVVIDSDQLARDVVAPGTDGLAAVAREFGGGVLRADGSLDRAALAAVIFTDTPAAQQKRERLEAIIHPRVRAEFRRLRGAAAPGSVVVNDIPILRTPEEARQFDVVVVVVAADPARIARLVERGLTDDDARARIAAQISDDERAALADVVIHNDSDEEALDQQVRALWQGLIDC